MYIDISTYIIIYHPRATLVIPFITTGLVHGRRNSTWGADRVFNGGVIKPDDSWEFNSTTQVMICGDMMPNISTTK